MNQTYLPLPLRPTPPVEVPSGFVGAMMLPGSNRQIWWTGRVAIGLRYERQQDVGSLTQSAAWIQHVLLDS